MFRKQFIALSFIFSIAKFASSEIYSFPDHFSFGASSAAYQIGAWNLDGKSPSVWDKAIHDRPEKIVDRTNGDIAADSYHFYKEDVKALKQVGHYRFSIAWTRILPDGSNVNMKGIEYYHKLIDELLANNIEPIVTMHHFDLPQYLQDLGGFLNQEVAEYFEHYADVLFKHFGGKVKLWITFNEPNFVCIDGYGSGVTVPFVKAESLGGEYICNHNLLIAHSKAYHLYKKKYLDSQHGKIGISPFSRYCFRKDSSVGDEVVERCLQYIIGLFLNPIFGPKGNYPQILINEIGNNSMKEGKLKSRLPHMSEKLQKQMKGSADFIALNYYTSRLVETNENADNLPPSYEKDFKITMHMNASWERADSPWLYKVPEGLYNVLLWIKKTYRNPIVLITENGCSDSNMEDEFRVKYLNDHLAAVSKAINKDGSNIIGYSVWSIIDNFEWLRGYEDKFGLFYVNFTSPFKERIPKKSVDFMKTVVQKRFVDADITLEAHVKDSAV